MRTSSGNTPHGANWYAIANDAKASRAWCAHERAAVTAQDVTDFLCCLWRLADEKKKATGNSGNLPSGIFAEEVRQQARKAGLAEYLTGTGWSLTAKGRNRVTRTA